MSGPPFWTLLDDATLSVIAIAIAGILLVILGVILFRAFDFVKEFIWDILTVSIEFYAPLNAKGNSRDNYGKIYAYIAKLTTLSEKKSGERLFGFWSHVNPLIKLKQEMNGRYNIKVKGGPNYGTRFFVYGGYWVRVILKSTPRIKTAEATCDMMKISTFKWHGEILKSLIVAATEPIYTPPSKQNPTTTVYGIHGDRWSPLGFPKPIRKINSVHLTKGQAESLIEDVQEFFDSKDWCETRSIPHHRGYLLHGPAGCGKTSLIRALAGQFEHGICALSLATHGLTDDALIRCLNSAPYKAIILIEDVDCTFKSRGDETASTAETNLVLAGSSGSSVTFRGLLNALDGVATCDGRIVFLTTNHPEKLDPALTRPGRIDVKIHLDFPNEEQLGRFFGCFYPEASEEAKNRFLDELKGLEKVSVAMVQGLFMLYKKSAEGAIANCKAYLKDQFQIVPTKA